MPGTTLEVLLQCVSPLKAWLQAQTAEGHARLFIQPYCVPRSSPHHALLWLGQHCKPVLAQAKQNPPGSQQCLRNNPEYNRGTVEDQVEGSGALTCYCSQNHTLSPLHCIYQGSNTPWVHTQKRWRTAFSQTCCLYSCNKIGFCPHILPIPKSHLLHLPLTCFSTNAFSVFPLTPWALPATNKAPAMPVDLALVQLLRLEAWLWAAALLLLYC